MIKYTITAQDTATDKIGMAYITSARPLTGEEPEVAQRVAALGPLLEPDDEFEAAFKKALVKQLEKVEK